MEIAIGIGIGIGIVIAAIAGGRKKRNKAPARPEAPEERRQRETDGLITVILPTSGNDN